jgi:hypothetical protein
MIREHDTVVLTEDLPGDRLKAGDVGAVVHIHHDGEAYEVEFVTLAGETVAVTTLRPQQLRPIGASDLAHVRELHAA